MANANVFTQITQPVKSVQDYDNERAIREENRIALQGKRRANALAEAAYQQQEADRVTLQKLAQESGGDENKLIAALRGSGSSALMDLGSAREKSLYERNKAQAEAGKTNAETLAKHLDAMKFLSTSVMASPSLQNATLAIDAFERLTGRQMPEERQRLQMMQSPDQIKEWAAGHALQADQLLPKLQTINAGGAQVNQAVNPITGTPVETGRTEITQSADNRATVGASLANAAATREAAKLQADATRAAANTRRDQDTEMKLADDYRGQSKSFKDAKDAYAQLSATLGSATTSPAATLAAATKFMKVLDPGSVVRESELGMALAASGVFDRAMNYVSTLQSGRKLTPSQAADFKATSDQIYKAAQSVQQDIDKDYQAKAKAYGLRPEMVTQDLGQSGKVVSWGDLK